MQSKKWELTRDKYMSMGEVRRLRRYFEDRVRSVNGLCGDKGD
jgi:hypothetical protein